jgi:tetratricopeptide (TPR) repeat protein
MYKPRLPLLPVLLAALLAAEVTAVPPAAAQDDWDVRRDPFDKSLIARYKRILAKNPSDSGALSKLTRLYARYRSVAQLIKEYEAQLAKNPKSFSTLVVLGHLAAGQGNTDPALSYYERAADLRPADAALLVAIADLHKKGGRVDQARAAYDKALAAASKKALKIKILRELAEIALGASDIDSAKKYYEQYIALDPKNVQALIDLGDALARHKRYDDAVKTLRSAESKLGGDPALKVEVVSRIGQALERAGKSDAAVREYRRAMKMVSRGYYIRRELTERIVGIYRERDQLSALVAELEKEWATGRRGHFEWDILARLYEETGLHDKALAAYRSATKKAPYELDTQRRLISLLETSGREREAVKQYEIVIRVAPGEPRFQLELAQRYWRIGDEKKALAMLKRIQSRFPGDPGVWIALADLYARWGKEDLSLAAHQKLAKIEPDESAHLVNLGEQYFQRNQRDKAIAVWKQIIRRKTAPNYARLAEVYADHNMAAEALEMFTKAIALDGKKAKFYQGRARVYERQNRQPQAIADWETVLSLTPDREANRPARREARRMIVHLLYRTSRSILASRVREWNRSFSGSPPDMGAGYFLVEAYNRLGDSKKTLAVLEKLLEHNPRDTEAMQELVKVYREQQKYTKAVSLLERMVAMSPGREREIYNQIAEIKTILREDDEAIRYAQKALEKSPNDPAAHLQLAERYVDMQLYEKAIAEFEKTLAHDPRNTAAYFALARLYRNRNQLDRAAKLYRELLRRSSDDEILLKAGRHAINLEELTGSLGELERILAPLSFTFTHKSIYRRILVELYARYVPQLVEQQSRGDAKARAAAGEELARLGTHGLKPLLEALADDGDAPQQRIAVAVLGYMGNPGAAPALVRLAKADNNPAPRSRVGSIFNRGLDWEVRVEALVAAGRLGDPRILPDLLELTEHRESSMREAAVFALGMTGDPKAVKALREALGSRLDSVRTLACLGMARMPASQVERPLLAVLEDSANPDSARAACAFAAGALGLSRAAPLLAETLREGNDETQRLAAWALGRLADPRTTEPLLAAYFTKRDQVRDAVAWALSRVVARKPDRSPIAAQLEYPMRNGKFNQAQAIAALVSEIEPPPLLPAFLAKHETSVIEGLTRSLSRHRDLVVRVLGDLDSRPGGIGLGPLTARLESTRGPARRQVEATLNRVGVALAPRLTELTAHDDPAIRRRALSVLAKIGDRGARPTIESAFSDRRLSVRLSAIATAAVYFRRTGDGAIAERLAATLARSKAWQERVAAARSLAAFSGRDPAIAALAAAVAGDAKSFVRARAAASLGELGDARGVDPLIRAASAKHEASAAVRLAATGALHQLGTADAKAALARIARTDPVERVRAAAGAPRGAGGPLKK